MKTSQLNWKKYLLLGSLIFGMFFGAGNLIFPIHLGQLAGSHWLSAAIGFIFSGVLLPLMALLAISITRSEGIYDLALPNGKWFALIGSCHLRTVIRNSADGHCAIFDRDCTALSKIFGRARIIHILCHLLWDCLLFLYSRR